MTTVMEHTNYVTHASLFKQIWRLDVPQRIRSFLWLVSLDRILTNAERARRHLAQDDSCTLCLGTTETTLHVLRDCTTAMDVWSNILLPEHATDFFSSDLMAWLAFNLDRKDLIDTDVPWNI